MQYSQAQHIRPCLPGIIYKTLLTTITEWLMKVTSHRTVSIFCYAEEKEAEVENEARQGSFPHFEVIIKRYELSKH
jgi:hypothetical protein